MWTRQYKKRNFGRLILPAVCAGFLAYFGFHAYHGEYGINSTKQLDARAAELQVRLDRLRSTREHLEARAQLLRDGTIERDMLDEFARRALGMSKADEIVIMLDVN